jgi:hypothetical protein
MGRRNSGGGNYDFTDRTAFRGSSENLRLIERFLRTGPATMDYEFTVDDPETFAARGRPPFL